MDIHENKSVNVQTISDKLRIQRKNQSFPVASLLILLNLASCAITLGSESKSLFVPWNCVFFQKGGTASCQKTSASKNIFDSEKLPNLAGDLVSGRKNSTVFIAMSNMNRTTQPVPGFLIGAALIPQVPEHVCMNHFEPLKGLVFQIVLRVHAHNTSLSYKQMT